MSQSFHYHYTGGQAFNYVSDYGAEIIKEHMPEFLDSATTYNDRPVYFWKVTNDQELRAFRAAIASKCPEINVG
jgi:hypothetical protein